jgi:alpha-glucoside transport system substrate-binding protein
MRRYRLHILVLAVLGAVLGVAAATAGSGTKPTAKQNRQAVSGTVSVISEATGAEQTNFKAVLAGFEKLYPNVTVRYTSAGRNLPTILATAVAGGNPPHIALLPQPGLMYDLIKKKALKPLTFVKKTVSARWSKGWIDLATRNGKLYAVYFKGANKSTIWYNVALFRRAGVKPPKTFAALLKAARTLRASGTRAYSFGGADGWTLTDLFENIYLRQAGPVLYDRLSNHRIKWTHSSVKAALRTMAKIVGDTNNIVGGRDGAIQTSFADSVPAAFGSNPKGAMVIEGDFVPGTITGATDAKPIQDFNYFAFPSIKSSTKAAILGGGDAVVMFKNTAAARAMIRYFTTPQAATIWARRGGFSSPNKLVKPSAYTSPLSRRTAIALARAPIFRFDLSDLQPASFGATNGQGLFKLFQDFLRNPRNVTGISRQMEQAAAAAYRK